MYLPEYQDLRTNMENLINLSRKRKQWCDRFLDRCVKHVARSNEKLCIESVSAIMTHHAGFHFADDEVIYVILKLKRRLK